MRAPCLAWNDSGALRGNRLAVGDETKGRQHCERDHLGFVSARWPSRSCGRDVTRAGWSGWAWCRWDVSAIDMAAGTDWIGSQPHPMSPSAKAALSQENRVPAPAGGITGPRPVSQDGRGPPHEARIGAQETLTIAGPVPERRSCAADPGPLAAPPPPRMSKSTGGLRLEALPSMDRAGIFAATVLAVAALWVIGSADALFPGLTDGIPVECVSFVNNLVGNCTLELLAVATAFEIPFGVAEGAVGPNVTQEQVQELLETVPSVSAMCCKAMCLMANRGCGCDRDTFDALNRLFRDPEGRLINGTIALMGNACDFKPSLISLNGTCDTAPENSC
eukprot:evm.model.scf_64.3 EVM.evm.TU.scf_64.3   scf_64:20165-27512(-)